MSIQLVNSVLYSLKRITCSKEKLDQYQDGVCYLTTHRIIYVDSTKATERAVELPLSMVKDIETFVSKKKREDGGEHGMCWVTRMLLTRMIWYRMGFFVHHPRLSFIFKQLIDPYHPLQQHHQQPLYHHHYNDPGCVRYAHFQIHLQLQRNVNYAVFDVLKIPLPLLQTHQINNRKIVQHVVFVPFSIIQA